MYHPIPQDAELIEDLPEATEGTHLSVLFSVPDMPARKIGEGGTLYVKVCRGEDVTYYHSSSIAVFDGGTDNKMEAVGSILIPIPKGHSVRLYGKGHVGIVEFHYPFLPPLTKEAL